MLKIKLAALLILPVAFFCSLAAAQKQQPKPSAAKTEAPAPVKAQTQTRPPVKPKPQRAVAVAEVTPTRKTAPVQRKTAPVQAAASDILPTACPTPVYAVPPGDVYGAYVPYVPPPPPIGCGTPTAAPAASNASQPNASVVQKPQPPAASLVNPESPTPFKLAPPTSTDLVLKADAAPAPAPPATPPADSSAEEGAFVQPVPLHRAPVIFEELRPFRSYAVGFTGSTLGAGFQIATPLAGRINLRYGFNLVEFTDPFNIDGINYHAGIHLRSSQTTVDWFFGSFHISPGLLYLKNNMSAPVSVGPGQTFVLGTQTFLNSVDDPVVGSSSVTYPRTFSPLLLFGYGNVLPRSGQHLSLPVEVGVAYTGAPQINLNLNGTACVTNGCVTFLQSTAQGSLKDELQILNEDLKHYSVFPIVSVGLAYRF
jgi:hypothetical protein